MLDLSGFEAEMAFFRQRVKNLPEVTPDSIRGLVEGSPFPYLDSATREEIARVLETLFDVRQTTGASVLGEDFKPWLQNRRRDINFYYWSRLQRFLLEMGSLPPAVVNALDLVTDDILDYAGDPLLDGSWRRRGMVLGHVQSGKTSNYSALICKAADAGYRIIILLAGISNLLRRQTQERIDESFIGRRAIFGAQLAVQYIGVSQFIIPGEARRTPLYGTSVDSDFTIGNARNYGVPLDGINEPIIFVVKKNMTILQNLRKWLEEMYPNGGIPHPLLLIDDEADNASINTSADPGKTTRINASIREILAMFSRASYCGYTATPFANIFIDPATNDDMLQEDLFPSDYIKSLDPPSNYVGPRRVFEEDGDLRDGMVRIVEDYQDVLPLKHKNHHPVDVLPPSLEKAVRVFVLTRGIRILRGDGARHCSMMINVSRFNSVQESVRGEVYRYFELLKHAVHVHAGLGEKGLRDSHMADMLETFREEFSSTGADWTDIQRHLPEAISSISIRTVNMRGGALDYSRSRESGLHVIAVGGLALSRGLTLEGLTVSYILRNASAYDTLMQMGRWFGYRPGYEDLCRLYITESSRDHYEHISDVTEELRSEIARMEAQQLTPRDFGLKVREHPEAIRITAANKMRHATRISVALDLSQKHIEGHTLFNNLEINRENGDVIGEFLSELGAPAELSGRGTQEELFWNMVGVQQVLKLLSRFKLPASNNELARNFRAEATGEERSLAQDYIIDRATGELATWQVAVPQLGTTPNDPEKKPFLAGFLLKYRSRSSGETEGDVYKVTGSSQRVADRSDSSIGLPEHQRKVEKPSDKLFLSLRTTPLLIIHAFKTGLKGSDKGHLEFEGNTAFSISICFPPTVILPTERTYQANAVWLQQMQASSEEDEEAEEVDF